MTGILTGGSPDGPVAAGGILTPVALQASAYAASPGDWVPVDTTSGPVTVTLPPQPADGTGVGVKMIRQGGANAVTVASPVDGINTWGTHSLILPLLYQGAILQYSRPFGTWYVLSQDLVVLGTPAPGAVPVVQHDGSVKWSTAVILDTTGGI